VNPPTIDSLAGRGRKPVGVPEACERLGIGNKRLYARKADQVVKVGDNITVTVVAIRGDQVRLGFQAPRHVQSVSSNGRSRSTTT